MCCAEVYLVSLQQAPLPVAGWYRLGVDIASGWWASGYCARWHLLLAGQLCLWSGGKGYQRGEPDAEISAAAIGEVNSKDDSWDDS